MKIKTVILLVFLFAVGVRAWSNPLILMPTGTTLTTGQFRAEAAFSNNAEEGKYYWFAAGLSQVELSIIRFEHSDGIENDNMFAMQWNFIPETSFNPAIAFGAQDITSEADGIAPFVAVTKHLPLSSRQNILKDFAVTVGLGIGGIKGPFFGFEAKLPWNIVAQGEFDSRDVNASIGWQPVSLLRFKAYTIRDEFYYGAELVPIQF